MKSSLASTSPPSISRSATQTIDDESTPPESSAKTGPWARSRAQRLYSVSAVAVSVLSTHLHLLAYFEDADQMGKFMCHAGGNLSRKVGRLQGWEGPMWARRYRGILVSDEEKAQIARLKYVLAAGVKEFLVDRVDQWPGVHSARALIDGEPLRGWWVDGTRASAARRRGERPSRSACSWAILAPDRRGARATGSP